MYEIGGVSVCDEGIVYAISGWCISSTTYAESSKCLTCGERTKNEDTVANFTSNIYLDILPGVSPKVINITSQRFLPIAVLGSSDFSVSSIDPNTLNLMQEGSAGKTAPFRWHTEDVAAPSVRDNKEPCSCQIAAADGYNDLILEFDIYEMIKLLDLQKNAGKRADEL